MEKVNQSFAGPVGVQGKLRGIDEFCTKPAARRFKVFHWLLRVATCCDELGVFETALRSTQARGQQRRGSINANQWPGYAKELSKDEIMLATWTTANPGGPLHPACGFLPPWPTCMPPGRCNVTPAGDKSYIGKTRGTHANIAQAPARDVLPCAIYHVCAESGVDSCADCGRPVGSKPPRLR